jgi:hypothetical protein
MSLRQAVTSPATSAWLRATLAVPVSSPTAESELVHDLRSLSRMWREATGRRAIAVPIPLPGKLGRALRDGRLTCTNPDVRGTQTFAAWLQANAR